MSTANGRKALLIGSPAHGLQGTLPDVERVADLLGPRGFEVRRCTGDEATRSNILSAYRTLIDDTQRGDPVVVYYSGHGARALDEAYEPPDEHAPEKRYHHFIVPMDLDDSSDGDFRGILSVELSRLLTQLTDRTRNVSVIFDCCHSGGMTRGMRLQPRGLAKEWFTGASTHMEMIKRGEIPGFTDIDVNVMGNPNAVRLMAALPSQQAWEYGGPKGSYGLMTDGLVKAFAEAGDRPVTWNAINRRVRDLVRSSEPGQYPVIEGPSSRLVFDLEEANLTGTLAAKNSDNGPVLEGGRLFDVRVGDEYLVMPSGFHVADPDKSIARAVVTHVGGSWSRVRLEEEKGDLGDGATAFPLRQAYPAAPVRVQVGSALTPSLEKAITESGLLRLPDEGETDATDDVLAVVEERDGMLHIGEQAGLDLSNPLEAVESSIATVITKLGLLARSRSLERLESGTGISRLSAEYSVDWGRVVAGVPKELPKTGALLFNGDLLYLRVRNQSQSTLYVSVFDIGLAGEITLLTRNIAPSGWELSPDGAPFTLGYAEDQGWVGLGPLYWPPEVPDDGQPRPESLIVVIADSPQDLKTLEARDTTAAKGLAAGQSDLERIADQISTARTRNLKAVEAPVDVRYAVEQISFMLDPTRATTQVPVPAAPSDRGGAPSVRGGQGAARVRGADSAVETPIAAVPESAGFLIDHRPGPSEVYRVARGVAPPPKAVAIQLGEVVVHSNKAWLGTDVRVDAMVITGGDSSEGAYRTGTARFSGVKDGDRLPLDNMLVFHGPVRGFVDLQVWVSRDDKQGLDLAELIKTQVNDKEFKNAGLVLAGLAVAAPAAGAVVAGIGAATVVANAAYKVLRAAVGKSIGLYRTSLLANQRFGVGRTPAHGAMRAQDFSFWYQVSEVEADDAAQAATAVQPEVELRGSLASMVEVDSEPELQDPTQPPTAERDAENPDALGR